MAPGPQSVRFQLEPAHAGQRLDRVLAALVPHWSRERLQRLIEAGEVELDGAPIARAAHTVAAGQQLSVRLAEVDELRGGNPGGGALRVLFEDEHLIAIDKPAGMVAHPSTTVRGGTVSELALERFGALPAPQGADRPGIVHRLDSDTSGVMILARSEAACESLLRQFREREVHKVYHALVQGEARFDSDWIDLPLARSPHHEGRVQIAAGSEGREALTFYRVLERFRGAAFVAAEPKTGRTHQIRAHLEAIGLPIFGDRLYRGRRRTELPRGAPALTRQALHASSLELAHPISGAPLRFESPLAADIAELLAFVRAQLPAAD